MENIGAAGTEILSEILTGIPMVRVKGGIFEGLKLVTKAGAFGGDDAAAFAMRKIKEKI
uniref:nucleotide-binding domain containing protein n=1 Tax=Muricomes intestini TaxID=1796634 RepID=UPI002FDD5393